MGMGLHHAAQQGGGDEGPDHGPRLVLRAWLTGCGLYRVNETTTNTGVAQELAAFPESSDTGDQRMVDTSILNATVDNTSYAYEIQCQIAGTDTSMYVGIYGATVTYKISSTNG